MQNWACVCRSLSEVQYSQRMIGDHTFFIGGNNQDLYTAGLRRDYQGMFSVGAIIDREAQPFEPLTDTAAHISMVLADPGRENDPINAAEHGSQRAAFARRAPDKQLNRFSR